MVAAKKSLTYNNSTSPGPSILIGLEGSKCAPILTSKSITHRIKEEKQKTKCYIIKDDGSKLDDFKFMT